MSKGKRPSSLRETLPGLRNVLKRLSPYLRSERLLLAGGAFAMFAAVAAKLAEPWPLKFIIDSVLLPTGDALPHAIASLSQIQLLGLFSMAVIVFIGLRATLDYLATIAFALAGNRILTTVREDMFRHLTALPLAFHTRQRLGDLTVRLISDVGMLKETTVTAFLPFVVNVLILAGMLSVMLWLNWQLTLIALAPLPLLALLSHRFGTRLQTVGRKQRKLEGQMAATASEALSGIKTVQALGLAQSIITHFVGAGRKSLRDGVKAKRLAAGLERSVDVLVAISTAAILFFGAQMVLGEELTTGELLVFLTYAKNTFRPIRDYAKHGARLAKATAAGERVIAILDEPLSIEDKADAVALNAHSGEIRINQLCFTYGERGALHDIHITLPPGQLVALTGPSGAGKSTLLSLLLRLYDPQEGSIEIDNQDIRHVSLSSLRKAITFVPQESVLLSDTLRANLILGIDREVTDDEILQALQLAAADDIIAGMPAGLDTLLAEAGASLSAGQRQRLSLARAALRKSTILILDEPTTGLDAANARLVCDAIFTLAKQRTTLIVSHDLNLLHAMDRVIGLEAGRIVEDAAPHELSETGLIAKLRKSYYDKQ